MANAQRLELYEQTVQTVINHVTVIFPRQLLGSCLFAVYFEWEVIESCR